MKNKNLQKISIDSFWKTTWRLFSYMKKKKILLLFVIILAIFSQILQINTPKVLGKATTVIFNGILKGVQLSKRGIKVQHWPINFNSLYHILFIVFLLYLGSFILRIIQRIIMVHISQDTVYQMRKQMKHKMMMLPISYYDTHLGGDLVSRCINDLDNIASTLQQSLIQFITSIVQFIGTTWIMFTISIKLSLIIIVTVPITLFLIKTIVPKSQKNFLNQQKYLGLINAEIEEDYNGQMVIKSFNHEKESMNTFNDKSRLLYESSWRAQLYSGILMPLMSFISNLSYVLVAIVGGFEVIYSKMTLGNVQAMLQYTNNFSRPMARLSNLANTIQLTIASADRVFKILDEKNMSNNHVHISNDKNYNAIIEFKNVNFGYINNINVINKFNLNIYKNKTTAIVGPTGAGKTTIINLLERFYDFQYGSIKFQGVDIRNIQRDLLRKHFAIVLQEAWLFKGTIWDNLKYGNEDATRNEILTAAKLSHVDDFISQLPNGYNTIIDESSSNISQGQRQLITIGRAIVANPEILILDEATSNVDTSTEIQIQEAIDNLLVKRTNIIIAHRLSTIENADNIIVMDHGSIVEEGNHKELLMKNGFYTKLYKSQFY